MHFCEFQVMYCAKGASNIILNVYLENGLIMWPFFSGSKGSNNQRSTD